jgi:2,5-furandicarboxylate decarboxylase 1
VVTRVQPGRDIFILPGGQGSRLDPSSDVNGVTDKIFIDATKNSGFRGKVAEPTQAMMKKIESRWKKYGFQ